MTTETEPAPTICDDKMYVGEDTHGRPVFVDFNQDKRLYGDEYFAFVCGMEFMLAVGLATTNDAETVMSVRTLNVPRIVRAVERLGRQCRSVRQPDPFSTIIIEAKS
jgi:hypothetical protein